MWSLALLLNIIMPDLTLVWTLCCKTHYFLFLLTIVSSRNLPFTKNECLNFTKHHKSNLSKTEQGLHYVCTLLYPCHLLGYIAGNKCSISIWSDKQILGYLQHSSSQCRIIEQPIQLYPSQFL